MEGGSGAVPRAVRVGGQGRGARPGMEAVEGNGCWREGREGSVSGSGKGVDERKVWGGGHGGVGGGLGVRWVFG